MKTTSEMKADESKFFHAYMRRTLVGWCVQGLANGDGSFEPSIPDDLPIKASVKLGLLNEMVEYARAKKWVSKTSMTVLGPGYKTAAGMMKVL